MCLCVFLALGYWHFHCVRRRVHSVAFCGGCVVLFFRLFDCYFHSAAAALCRTVKNEIMMPHLNFVNASLPRHRCYCCSFCHGLSDLCSKFVSFFTAVFEIDYNELKEEGFFLLELNWT